jgi:hypothetical protein
MAFLSLSNKQFNNDNILADIDKEPTIFSNKESTHNNMAEPHKPAQPPQTAEPAPSHMPDLQEPIPFVEPIRYFPKISTQ